MEKFNWEIALWGNLMADELHKWEQIDEDFTITPQFEAVEFLYDMFKNAEEGGRISKDMNPENAWDIGWIKFYEECVHGKFDSRKRDYGIDITKWEYYVETSERLARKLLDNIADYHDDILNMIKERFDNNAIAKTEWEKWFQGKKDM